MIDLNLNKLKLVKSSSLLSIKVIKPLNSGERELLGGQFELPRRLLHLAGAAHVLLIEELLPRSLSVLELSILLLIAKVL